MPPQTNETLLQTSGTTRPRLGAGSALLAYAALLLGMFTIGFGSQQRGVVAGLWITEALAIALPAVIALRAAGLRFPAYLGLRAPRWQHLLGALVLGLLNSPWSPS